MRRVSKKEHVDSAAEEGDESKDKVDDLPADQSMASEEDLVPKRRLRRAAPEASQTSSNPSQQLSQKELKALEKKRREKEQKRKALRRFLDDQAELGSDNEENDDVRKHIAADEEEDEDGLDEDLKDFVV